MRPRAGLLLLLSGLLAGALAQDHDAPPRAVRFGVFATADLCARCHANAPDAGAMRDGQGRAIAPYDLWRGTMMANAARDPVFRAAMAAEIATVPSKRAEIEAKCLRCHAPMAHEEMRRRDGRLGADVFAIGSVYTALALDGVSCAVCHQIRPENLGTPESFSGGFVIGDEAEIYGPHDDLFGRPMRTVSGYWPVAGDHVRDSAMCATCHTLFVDTVDARGEPTGHRLPEQTPYLEWRNSAFEKTHTCQDCHVPTTDAGGTPVRTRIAREPEGTDFTEIGERSPFGRHLFVGGNTLVPALLRDHGGPAPKEAYDAVIAAAREQLSERTARLSITDVVKGAEFTVRVENLAGHKFPTAHPSRRAWLRVRVRTPGGKLLFAAGEHDDRGRILGADGTPLASEAAGGPILPHRGAVGGPGEVQVWEAVLSGPDGAPEFRALRAAGFLKDNRILPRGWRADHADATKPVGTGDDEDFEEGTDAVIVSYAVPDEVPVYVIEADLLYQPLSPRWTAELFTVDAPEVAALRAMLEKADTRPELVATARLTVLR